MLLIIIACCIGQHSNAQDTKVITTSIVPESKQADTIPSINLNETELDKLTNIKAVLEKQNRDFSIPFQPTSALLRFIQKDEPALSDEAMYWVNYVRDASMKFGNDITFKDTVIIDPKFMPLLFKGGNIPKNALEYDQPWKHPKDAYSDLYKPDTTLFQDEITKQKYRNEAYRYIERNRPELYKYTIWDLPNEIPQPNEIKTNLFKELFSISNDADFNSVGGPGKFVPKIRYWRPYFESAIQFSQNYITPNWHKGGNGNMNLFTRNYFRYNYNKDKIQFTNELEWKATFYTAPKDTLHDYRIGDDVFRIHSNLGYKAFSKWFYTFDAEFKTQLFTNFQENSTKKLATFLSPMNMNISIGMKYELNKNFKQKHKNLALSVNLGPLAYNYMYSVNKDIDLGRHGFKDGKNYLSNIGSTIKANLTFNLTRTISWQSRFDYFTSYSRIIGEFENTLNLAISRFFSTRLYLNLRYDDGVKKKDDFDSYIQVNEIISFGFNYKW